MPEHSHWVRRLPPRACMAAACPPHRTHTHHSLLWGEVPPWDLPWWKLFWWLWVSPSWRTITCSRNLSLTALVGPPWRFPWWPFLGGLWMPLLNLGLMQHHAGWHLEAFPDGNPLLALSNALLHIGCMGIGMGMGSSCPNT